MMLKQARLAVAGDLTDRLILTAWQSLVRAGGFVQSGQCRISRSGEKLRSSGSQGGERAEKRDFAEEGEWASIGIT